MRDGTLSARTSALHEANYGVYRARKMWYLLHPEGVVVARCTVQRLKRDLGLTGAVRGRAKRMTVPGEVAERPGDLVDGDSPLTPDRLWVADLTYFATWSGFIYLAVVMDVFSRRVVRWRCSTSPRADLALDALEQGLWERTRATRDIIGLICRSDRGVQYVAIR